MKYKIGSILFLWMWFQLFPAGAAIEYGDRGNTVLQAQRLLIARGYMAGSADGIYGRQMEQAVKRFQKEQGLPESGVVDRRTLQVLIRSRNTSKEGKPHSSSYQSMNKEPLRKGAKGDGVKHVQELLMKTGYLSGQADGSYGEYTEYAVQIFQDHAGLPVTGEVDSVTLKALEKKSGQTKNAPEATNTSDSSSISTDDVLKKGDRGDGVKHVQELLMKTGYLSGQADGSYGEYTEYAVQIFQDHAGLPVTGRVDDATLKALEEKGRYEKVENGKEKKDIVAKRGDKGEAVRNIQHLLINQGYLIDSADGTYGNNTEYAVKSFQKEQGISVTGKVDGVTLAAIRENNKRFTVSAGQEKKGQGAGSGQEAPSRYIRVILMMSTAYSTEDPGSSLYTARGHRLRRGYVAVDPKVIPLGTNLYVEGYGYAVADDTGGLIKGNRIDLAVDSYAEAIAYGVKDVQVYVLE
ncbi:MAG: peptidoglycan-binding protein [Dialister invisus]